MTVERDQVEGESAPCPHCPTGVMRWTFIEASEAPAHRQANNEMMDTVAADVCSNPECPSNIGNPNPATDPVKEADAQHDS